MPVRADSHPGSQIVASIPFRHGAADTSSFVFGFTFFPPFIAGLPPAVRIFQTCPCCRLAPTAVWLAVLSVAVSSIVRWIFRHEHLHQCSWFRADPQSFVFGDFVSQLPDIFRELLQSLLLRLKQGFFGFLFAGKQFRRLERLRFPAIPLPFSFVQD